MCHLKVISQDPVDRKTIGRWDVESSSSSPKVWKPQAEDPTMLLVVGMEISRSGNGHHRVLPHTGQAGPPHSQPSCVT